MNLNASDLDKIMQYQSQNNRNRTAGRYMSVHLGGHGLLRSCFSAARLHPASLLFAALFLGGLLVGTLLVQRSSSETLATLQSVLGGYVESRSQQHFAAIAASTFSSLMLPLLILFFCGFCSISQPIILAVPLIKGLGYGFSTGMLYAQSGTAALSYVAVLLFPSMLLSALLLMLACRASMALAVTLFRATMLGDEPAERSRIKRYCVKFLIFTVFCILIAVLDAFLYTRFGGSIVL